MIVLPRDSIIQGRGPYGKPYKYLKPPDIRGLEKIFDVKFHMPKNTNTLPQQAHKIAHVHEMKAAEV